MPNEAALPIGPTAIWIIACLEVAIEYEAEKFILLTRPYYPYEDHDPPRSANTWYLPFVGFNVEMGLSGPEIVEDLRSRIATRRRQIDLAQELSRFSYGQGFVSPKLTPLGEMTELKTSPRSPEEVKAYHIVRYGCKMQSRRAICNLTDPDCSKGHTFMPLNRLSEVLIDVELSGAVVKTFRGAPLVSNLAAIVTDPAIAGSVGGEPTHVEQRHFVTERVGLLILLDIAGYGAADEWAREKGGNYVDPGFEVAERFRLALSIHFEKFLIAIGADLHKSTGDGFLVAIDLVGGSRASASAIARLVTALDRLSSELALMNNRVGTRGNSIGARVVVHYGNYKYGRIAGPLSSRPDFSGPEVVALFRSEAGLSVFAKAHAGDHAPTGDASVFMGFTEEALGAVPDIQAELSGWDALGARSTKIKEYNVALNVFARGFYASGQLGGKVMA